MAAFIISNRMFKFCFGLLLSGSIFSEIYAGEPERLFRSDEIVRIELKADFSAIEAERTKIAEYHDGELIYYAPDGNPVNLSVRLMPRGHFRRDTANCDFPPLAVDFKKGEVKNTLFENQNEIKLVTPCVSEKDVLDEYLIYKMYNKITDLSMNARLVKILYFDTGTQKRLFERYSFFLEKKKDVAERNNCIVMDTMILPKDIDRENFKKFAIFQYMIGNGDWFFRLNVNNGANYLKLNRNFSILQSDDSSSIRYIVPYDFDLSSFVNAEYAGINKTKRKYKGLCFSQEEFNEVFAYFNQMRPEFESVINNAEYVSPGARRQLLNYLDDFYSIIEDPKMIQKEFTEVCQDSPDVKFTIK